MACYLYFLREYFPGDASFQNVFLNCLKSCRLCYLNSFLVTEPSGQTEGG